VKFLASVVAGMAGLAVAAFLFDGIYFDGPRQGMAEIQEKFIPLVLTGLIFGVVTSVVAPVVRLVALPLVILTIGLFLLVINAGMLALTAWLADQLGLPFHVEGFWTAVGGAIVITLVTWAVEPLFESSRVAS
jgi:putative membrane protein